MRINVAYLLPLLVLAACVEPLTQQAATEDKRSFSEDQRKQATKVATLCALDKAGKFARQPGSPTELGMLAARACREDIRLAAFIYADGDERMAANLYPRFLRSTAETAALQIAEQRAM